MEWSPQQDRALRRVDRWLRQEGPQVFRMFGYAGTGKTTLARVIGEQVNGLVLFGAYTGKAAHVLRTKGCPGASTIHSLIYNPAHRSRERLTALELALQGLLSKPEEERDPEAVVAAQEALREERRLLSQPSFDAKDPDASPVSRASLVVLDEASFVDETMARDLMSYGTKILVLGDPAQLPPPRGGAGFFTEGDPDVMLTEIHRQARDNPIIELATMLREHTYPAAGRYGTSEVLPERAHLGNRPLEGDQLLVGRNRTRRACNARMRQLLDLDPDLPVAGDKLVCLRNNHDLGLLNGSLWHVGEVSGSIGDEVLEMDVLNLEEGTGLDGLSVWSAPFRGEDLDAPWWERRDAEEFDYGYALTVHKAQGSQWGSVLLLDESAVFTGSRWRWLYTGVTRAVDSVTIAPR